MPNPQPPYDVSLPPRWQDVPFADLPKGLQHKVLRSGNIHPPDVVDGDGVVTPSGTTATVNRPNNI